MAAECTETPREVCELALAHVNSGPFEGCLPLQRPVRAPQDSCGSVPTTSPEADRPAFEYLNLLGASGDYPIGTLSACGQIFDRPLVGHFARAFIAASSQTSGPLSTRPLVEKEDAVIR